MMDSNTEGPEIYAEHEREMRELEERNKQIQRDKGKGKKGKGGKGYKDDSYYKGKQG